MDPYEQNPNHLDDAYPYDNYYSTGGSYRPPRPPRNYGWLVAVMGVILLCVSGISTVYRGYVRADVAQSAGDSTSTVQASAVTEAVGQNVEEAETPVYDTAALLGSGTVLNITESDGTELPLQDIYKKVIPSVVSITAMGDSGTSTGTGIIMSKDGYIITNYHVVSTAKQVAVLLTSGEEYVASKVGGDETSDLMVLKIEAQDLTPAEFGDSDTAEVGDTVVAIGDPLGTELRGTMTDGIICGIQRNISVEDRTMTLIQTNAALNSGNSGGPLVNMEGQVIGINTMKIASSYTAVEGIGFAIPIASAKPIVDELVDKGYVTGRPAFGFTVETLEAQVMLFYDLPGRLCIRSVEDNSDAYVKGIREGDIITAIEGVEVSSTDEFNRIKNQYVAGDELTLTIYRNGSSYDVSVKLMDRAELNH